MNASLRPARGELRRNQRRTRRSPQESFRSAAPRGPPGTAPQPASRVRASAALERASRAARGGHAPRTRSRTDRTAPECSRHRQAGTPARCTRQAHPKAAAQLQPARARSKCRRDAPDTTREGPPTCRWRLASQAALQRPRELRWLRHKAASCEQHEGVSDDDEHAVRWREPRLLGRRAATTFAAWPPRTRRTAWSQERPAHANIKESPWTERVHTE